MIKIEFHRKSPLPNEFAERVVDIFELSKSNLNIYDAVVGMECMGPSGRNLKDIGLILASVDAITVDSWFCNYLGKKADFIPILKIAKERGLGEGNLDNIIIIIINNDNGISNRNNNGNNIINDKNNQNSIMRSIKNIDSFKFPSNINQTMEYFPSSLAKGIMKLWWSRPAIYEDICKNCNICLKSCPTNAMDIGENAPSFDYSKCINCLCCVEMCDKRAMYMKKCII